MLFVICMKVAQTLIMEMKMKLKIVKNLKGLIDYLKLGRPVLTNMQSIVENVNNLEKKMIEV